MVSNSRLPAQFLVESKYSEPPVDRKDAFLRQQQETHRQELFCAMECRHWSMILSQAAGMARDLPKRRPCDWNPWHMAMERLRQPSFALSSQIWAVANKPWPDDPSEVISLAIAFLEADPMFRDSGYMKRRIAKRLRQVELDDACRSRVEAVLRRAVMEGSGREEFREYCKLACKLQLTELAAWLEPMAKASVTELAQFWKLDAGQWNDPVEKQCMNARRMLAAIQRRYPGWSEDWN